MSTAWRASVEPTASIRSRIVPSSAGATSTGMALGAPPHRRRRLAVDPLLMIGHGAADDGQQQGRTDRELGA